MGGPGSGRRKLITPDVQLPNMGETEESLGQFAEQVGLAVAKGKLDRRDAEIILKAVSIKLTAVRDRRKWSGTDELRKMLDEANKIASRGLAQETADRQHAGDTAVAGIEAAEAS